MITDQAFILHKRAYKDSSEIIKLLTKNNGVVDVIAKGCLRPKSKFNGQLQPFVLTTVNFIGKSNLKTLVDAEQNAVVLRSAYKSHVSMLYCNELLTLIKLDEHTAQAVFNAYRNTVKALQQQTEVRLALRRFEWHLCCQLGYELSLPATATDQQYVAFDPINGLIISDSKIKTYQHSCTVDSFKSLIAMKDLSPEQLLEISSIMRFIINHLVNGKTIQSRQLLKTN